MKGHVLVTKLLIQEDAHVNSRGGHYGNALQAAAYTGHKNAVEILLEAGANVHEQGLSKDAFHVAAEEATKTSYLFFSRLGSSSTMAHFWRSTRNKLSYNPRIFYATLLHIVSK